MHRARAAALAFFAALALSDGAARAQQSAPDASAGPPLQQLFDEGREALRGGNVERSARLFYEALELMRATGREGTADGGLVSAYLASALDRLDHPQADEAFERAMILLSRAADTGPFVETANAWLTRLHRLGHTERGAGVAETLVRRMEAPGTPDDARVAALNIASDFLAAIDRKTDADGVILRLGPILEATTPQGARVRGIARLGLARASQADGRVNDFIAHVEGAISDLRRAMPETTKLLLSALNMRGKMLFEEGLYRDALPVFTEAAQIAPDDPDAYIESASLRARVLSRLERNEEALAAVERMVADVETRSGAESRLAFAARLDRVEMLMNAGRREDSLAALEAERIRLGGKADAHLAAQYFDRLAAIEIAEEDYPAAAKSAERAIDAYRVAFPKILALQLEPMRKRARASEGVRDPDYADRAFRELIALSSSLYRPEHPEVARDLNAYASFLQVAGRLGEAEALLRRALAGLERAYGGSGPKFVYGLNNLAQVVSAAGRRQEAAQMLERALAAVGEGPEQAETRVVVRLNYANAINFLGRGEEALRVIELVRADLPLLTAQRDRHALNANMVAALSLAHLGRLEQSWDQGARAFTAMQVRTREDAQNAVSLLLQMADVARRAGDLKNALAAASEAAKLMTSQGVETDYLWREWAQITLPALWRGAAEPEPARD